MCMLFRRLYSFLCLLSHCLSLCSVFLFLTASFCGSPDIFTSYSFALCHCLFLVLLPFLFLPASLSLSSRSFALSPLFILYLSSALTLPTHIHRRPYFSAPSYLGGVSSISFRPTSSAMPCSRWYTVAQMLRSIATVSLSTTWLPSRWSKG